MLTTKVVAKPEPAGFKRITWATNALVPGDLFGQNSATVSQYREWIDCGGYSAVLYEGSLIQMSYDFDYSRLIGHRLLYFPCPFDLDLKLLETFTLSEVVDLYESQEAPSVRLRSPVRFDYDSYASSSTHPASHMTFQWSHSRLPVMSPISPGHFFQFVFRNFYPALWNVHPFIKEWPIHKVERTITPEEESVLHLNSA